MARTYIYDLTPGDRFDWDGHTAIIERIFALPRGLAQIVVVVPSRRWHGSIQLPLNETVDLITTHLNPRTTLPDGREFPTYEDGTLSWDPSCYMTWAEEQKDYPRARAVLAETETTALLRLQRRALRDSFDRMFGHNASKFLRIVEDEIATRTDDNPAPHPTKITYLAVLPRHRKPKVIPKSAVGYYQKEAKYFYVAPGMTAAEARQAIAEGSLQPTWIDGHPVVAYSAETGKPRTEKRAVLGDLMKEAEEYGPNVVLRLNRDVYTQQYNPDRYDWNHRIIGPLYNWHKADISGMLYSPRPLTHGDLARHVERHDTFEMVVLREDYHGVPMGGLVSIARAGMSLADSLGTEEIRHQMQSLSGRRWAIREILDAGTLTPADLEVSYNPPRSRAERSPVSSDPYTRAYDRIRNLVERDVDVEQHTLLRLSKTYDPDKIEGIYLAARDFGMHEVRKAAAKRYRQVTGRTLR